MRALQTVGLVVAVLVVTLSGCTTLSRKNAVPHDLQSQAEIEGMPGVRYKFFSHNGLEAMMADLRAGMNSQEGFINKSATTRANYLSISGGGDNGAFGAGLLTGWTERGDRPEFNLVTGVSTGALIAPFAFLGSDYDYVLKRVYTEVSPTDVFINNGLMGALFSDSFADTTPLYKLITEYVNEDLLKKIGEEYTQRNRWLLVASTNLDAGVPTLWNMGKLASVGTPESLQLFRKILLASSAIPGAFPPVMIDVVADGKHYQEMHVDGGATMEVFLYPTALGAEARRKNIVSRYRDRQAYIIRNARLDSEWREIERNTLSIMGRAVDQLIQSQGYGDLQRIYLTTKRDHIGFNLAYIGPDFKEPHTGSFDRKYMNVLYNYGRGLARAGYPWAQSPPGFNHALNDDVRSQVNRQQLLLKGQPTPQSSRQSGK